MLNTNHGWHMQVFPWRLLGKASHVNVNPAIQVTVVDLKLCVKYDRFKMFKTDLRSQGGLVHWLKLHQVLALSL